MSSFVPDIRDIIMSKTGKISVLKEFIIQGGRSKANEEILILKYTSKRINRLL